MAVGYKNKSKSSAPKSTKRLRCQFCVDDSRPNYLMSSLSHYITEKGKLIPQTRSGLCHKHQRLMTLEAKKARYLALLPFTTSLR